MEGALLYCFVIINGLVALFGVGCAVIGVEDTLTLEPWVVAVAQNRRVITLRCNEPVRQLR